MSDYVFIWRNFLNFHEKTDLETQILQRMKKSFLASHAFKTAGYSEYSAIGPNDFVPVK